jgi:hypothetical protein
MKSITAALAAAALLCLTLSAHGAVKSSKLDPPTVTLKRGSSNITPSPATMEACEPLLMPTAEQDGVARESGSAVYACTYTVRLRVAFGKNPPPAPTCTAPKPAQDARIQTCPAGTVGTWSQTMDYVAAPYPDCWAPGEWTPAKPAEGICATPELRVYTCADASADGRILEDKAGAIVDWPNCASVGYRAPDKSLVVAVNPGTWPLYWRLASSLTSERIWTQTGGVGAWVRASAIDWGAAPMTGTATISWTPPTENTDGSKAVLTGYRIHYGTSATSMGKTIDVNGAVTSYVVENLTPGNWYFAVSAVAAYGTSDLSSVASKTLP